ncbi:MAG: hypothetical protein IKK58_06840 [Clostridia bacterium]|nr:hypothetical protein [Clostridia bacterium]
MKSFFRSKYLPYALGLVCAVMFCLVHINTQLQSGAKFFSEEIMGHLSMLLMLLDLIPLFLERIIYTHEHRNIKGLGVVHWIKVGIMALAFISAAISFGFVINYMFFASDGLVTVPINVLLARAGGLVATGGFTVLMISSKHKSPAVVDVSALCLIIGMAVNCLSLHVVNLVGAIGEIINTCNQYPDGSMTPIIFMFGFVNLIWFLCAFLVVGVSIYLGIKSMKRVEKGDLPLEYL